MPNLVKLYTHNGAVWIDTDQFNSRKHCLTIYTQSGKRLSDAGRTKEIRESSSYGVHPDNLYGSKKHAEADRARIEREIFGKAA